MEIKEYKNKLDKLIYDNKIFSFLIIVLSIVVLLEGYVVFYKIDSQKVVILPPSDSLKEFWIAGNNVSTSYLEMMSDVISYNLLNVTSEKKINIDFILAMTPSEYFNQVKSAITSQMKYVQDNGITQVFYITKYDTHQRGFIKVTGILKQFVGERKVESTLHSLIIQYVIEFGKFQIKGIELKKEGINVKTEEEEQK